MPDFKLEEILPPEEILFLKDLESKSGVILDRVDYLYKEKSQLDKYGNLEVEVIHKRGYVIQDGHIVKLSLRTHFFDNKFQAVHLGDAITELPSTIKSLKELSYLDLFGNHFSKLLPLSIFEIKRLKSLILGGNSLKELDKSIGQLTGLKLLDLNRNQLTQLPESLGDLLDLEQLILLFNRLTELPKSIGKLRSVYKINLNGNSLSSFPESFFDLTNLKHLDLSDNNLVSFPDKFGEFTNLEYLNLAGNLIRTLPESISKLSHLHYLNLEANQIESLPSNLDALEKLEELYIGGEKIELFPESIGKLRSIRKLELSMGKVRTIPSIISNLTSLQELMIVNTLSEKIPETIRNLRNLTQLILNNNKIKEVPTIIDQLENLKILILDYNQLKNIPRSIGNLKSLEELSLSNNQLSELPFSIRDLDKLTELSIGNNKFTQLPSWLWRLNALQKLYLTGNPWYGDWQNVVMRDLIAIKKYCREKDCLKVFISHAVVDYESHRIKELSKFLEEQEEVFQAYFCEADLRGNIDEFMNLVVPQCQILIFIGTKQSIYHSVDCNHELALAKKHGLQIIPIKGTDVSWSDFEVMGLKSDNGIEFSDANFEDFCNSIQDLIHQFYETIKSKEEGQFIIEKNLENIQKIIFEYIDNPSFKDTYKSSIKDFENLKLELKSVNLNPNIILYKFAELIIEKRG